MKKMVLGLLFSCMAITTTLPYRSTPSFKKSHTWAKHISINLYDCSGSKVRSQAEISRFIRNVCSALNATPLGQPQILFNYAGNGYTSGISAIQLANGHTDIAVRANDLSNDIYIDIFTCIPCDTARLANLAYHFFLALDMDYETNYRD